MKFIPVVALSALALSTAAMADAGKFTGFTTSVFGGLSMLKADLSGKGKSKSHLGGNGGFGGLELGYTKDFGKTVLGLSAHGYLDSLKGKSGDDKAKRKHGFGVTMRPGAVIGDSTLALVLGWDYAKWAADFDKNKSKYRSGFATGLAATMPLSQRVMIGAEYRYTWYQKISNKGMRVKPRTGDAMVKLSYKW